MNLSWTETWNDLLARASGVVGLDPGVLWPALVILIIVLAWGPARRWGRTLVTIVHEAGHAAVGLMVGRRFLGFVVSRDLSGHAVTAGKPDCGGGADSGATASSPESGWPSSSGPGTPCATSPSHVTRSRTTARWRS